MTIYRCDVLRPYTTGQSEDVAVNVLHYRFNDAGTPSNAQFDTLRDAIVSYFNDSPAGGGVPICTFLGWQLSRVANECSINFYEVPDTPGDIGSPVATRNWTLGPAESATVSLPAEVAVVMSYAAITQDIPEREPNPTPPPAFFRPRARRRGRMFIGPLITGVMSLAGGASGPQRVNNQFRELLPTMASQTLAGAGVDWSWQVFSTVDWEGRGVVQASCDDAFDTQRSRGVAPTDRFTVIF